MADSARDAITTMDRLVALHAHNTERIAASLSRSTTVLRLLAYLEQHPMMVIGRAAEAMQLSYNALAKATDALCTMGILTKRDAHKRNRVFVYAEYLDILSEGTQVDIS